MPFGDKFIFLGPILMILFWIVIIILIVYLIHGDL